MNAMRYVLAQVMLVGLAHLGGCAEKTTTRPALLSESGAAGGSAASGPAAQPATAPAKVAAVPATSPTTAPTVRFSWFTRRVEPSRITIAMADIATLELTLDSFEIDNGRYPTNEEGLNALVKPPANAPHWQGPYLKRGVPKDPWGNAYIYRRPGTHNKEAYDLSSMGPDGREGGGDDIDNWSPR